jgi:hypothetical protein
MSDERASVQLLSEWLQASRNLAIAVEGLTDDDLNLRGEPDGWSVRENVHHMVESYLAACTIVIAAVGTSGYAYDCSWMNLDLARMERMGYGRVAMAPAVEMLSAQCRYVAALLSAAPDALRNEVKLLEAPGAEPYVMTVEEMIRQEAEHARKHLQAVNDALRQRHPSEAGLPNRSSLSAAQGTSLGSDEA